MATHSNVLAWSIPGTLELGGLQSMGSHRVGHNWSELAAAAAWRPTRPFRTNTQNRCSFHYRELECKSRKPRNTWVTGKFGHRVQNEAGQRLIEFCQENSLVIANTLFQQDKKRLHTWTSSHGQQWNQMIIFFVAKDAKALYSQQKQDQEWTVAQIMNSLLPNSDLNWRKWGKPLYHSVWPKSNPLWLYSGSEK